MTVIPSRHLEKQVAKLPKKIKTALSARLRLFIDDIYSPVLNNHHLHGSKRNYRSINITGDYRLVYEQYDENTARLIDIDTHSNLYGK